MSAYSITVPGWLPTWQAPRSAAVMLRLHAERLGIPPATGKRRLDLTITLVRGLSTPDADASMVGAVASLAKAGLLLGPARKWWAPGKVAFDFADVWGTCVSLEDLDGLSAIELAKPCRGSQKVKREPGKTYLQPRRHRR